MLYLYDSIDTAIKEIIRPKGLYPLRSFFILKIMELDKFFKGTDISLTDNDIQASRKQVQKLYDVPKRTLAETINSLKKDGLVVGGISPNIDTQAVGAAKNIETYDLNETISIGFRLRSPIAIKFQRWARSVLKGELKKLQSEKIDLQRQNKVLDYGLTKEIENNKKYDTWFTGFH